MRIHRLPPGERSQRIQTLYDDIRAVFPDAEASDDTARADAEERGVAPAQYFLDFDHLEVTVSDSDAQAASQWIQDYATKNGLGIYDVDATGKMTLPDEDSQPPMSKGAASAGR
ncbi:hypothetical protein C3B44_03745 [Corynebacterium yudongzhengii]|uniref:Uncharacterized protein n=1 Tax=Corynebacterium yudongzhengii TaxID=2080740 RepID=A0A2U1T6D3_9CORY|nr:hypothetical protein [Corynebacterium yudongzhengii]AWB81582.1 hypothetical protein C3B44_03745 [Corynebacterium yudongzhengii]PWC01567.1 hypothetical protein DF222_06405 [Corynebacterium yudongzhengii]